MGRRATGRGQGRGFTVLVALVVVMGGAAAGLTLRAVHVAGGLPGVRAEPYLELVAVAVGGLAAAWVAASAALGLGCVVARAAGRSWAVGERLVLRAAPRVVRRAARVGVGVSVGAGLVLSGGAAHASAPPPDEPAVVAVDLGWRASAPDTGSEARDTSTPAPERPGHGDEDATPPTEPRTADRTADGGVVTAAGAATGHAAAEDTATDSATDAAAGAGATSGGAISSAAGRGGAASAAEDAASRTAPVTGAETERDAGAQLRDAGTERGAATTAPGATGAQASSVPTSTGGAESGPRAAAGPDRRATPGQGGATRRGDALLTATRDVSGTAAEVVVVRGDTLWSVAARHLPPDATAADVASAVQRWHAANADVVGEDPDLILPGQVLTAPVA